MKLWHVVGLLVVTTIAMLLAAGQVVTFIWLSSFPEQAHRLSTLEGKVWLYTAACLALLVADTCLAVTLVRRLWRKRLGGSPAEPAQG